MSLHALTWALYGHHKELDPASRLMLVVLADHAGPEGIAWPSWSTLAQGAGISRSTVARRITTLQEHGLITPVDAEHCPASWAKIPTDRRPKAYRLTLPAGYQTDTPRGVRTGPPGSQIGPTGVSAVTPEPKEPKEPCAHDEPRGPRYCALCRRAAMRTA